MPGVSELERERVERKLVRPEAYDSEVFRQVVAAKDCFVDEEPVWRRSPEEIRNYIAKLQRVIDVQALAIEVREPRHNAQVEGKVNEEPASARVADGGSDYNRWPIQPGYFSEVNKLSYFEGSIIKRILSARTSCDEFDDVMALEEYDKAIHEIELLKEWRLGEEIND